VVLPPRELAQVQQVPDHLEERPHDLFMMGLLKCSVYHCPEISSQL
jgi:hypothetical protein